MRTTTLVALSLLLAPSAALAGEWVSESGHTAAHFSVQHMMVSTTRGAFQDVSATLNLDEKDITRSTVTATVAVASLDTGNEKRDTHLKAADFFDAKKHPELTFTSTKVRKAGKNRLKVTGELTIRGKTLPATFDVKMTPAVKSPWGGLVRGVRAETTIDRTDWGLTWNKAIESGGFVVGEEVTIVIDAEFQPKKTKTAMTR